MIQEAKRRSFANDQIRSTFDGDIEICNHEGMWAGWVWKKQYIIVTNIGLLKFEPGKEQYAPTIISWTGIIIKDVKEFKGK
jgi:hypothetical protein